MPGDSHWLHGGRDAPRGKSLTINKYQNHNVNARFLDGSSYLLLRTLLVTARMRTKNNVKSRSL